MWFFRSLKLAFRPQAPAGSGRAVPRLEALETRDLLSGSWVGPSGPAPSMTAAAVTAGACVSTPHRDPAVTPGAAPAGPGVNTWGPHAAPLPGADGSRWEF